MRAAPLRRTIPRVEARVAMLTLLPLLALVSAAAPAKPAPPPSGSPAHAPGGGAMLERAAGDLERLHKALREVLSRVEDARREKDLVKLLCADEKLSQIKQLVTVAERAELALTEAVASGDEGAAVESSKIEIARRKVDAVRAEAAACIGQLAYETEERTSVFVEEPGDLPDVGAVDPDPYRTAFGIPSAGR